MERKNFAVLCAAVLCFWLFALALGTAEGVGLRAVMHPEERAVSADVEEAAEGILLPAAAAAPQLDLNCRAVVDMTQIALPCMGKGGHIIQIASSASFQPLPGLNVYAASKAFVRSYTRALRF